MKIPMLDVAAQHAPVEDALREAFDRVMKHGQFILGPEVDAFEKAIAAYVGTPHAIGVSSGTDALLVALMALDVGPGDEVITTPFSFIASSNCILYVGATPVFVDIEPRSLNMDPAKVEAAITPRTKAILAVECFGNPRHMDAYRSIAARHEIRLIEDCCEGLGGSMNGRPVGGFGNAGVFGFYPNKQITTGEGGMIVTDDDRLANVCRSLRNQGRPINQTGNAIGSWMQFERLGYNYRMPELNAALGLSQVRRLEEIVAKRQAVADRYMQRFMAHPDIILPNIDPGVVMSWFVFVVRLSDRYGREDRDRIIQGLHRHDIGAAPYFPCIHLQPFYRERFGFEPGMFPVAESVSNRTIALPFFNELSARDEDHAAQTLEHMIGREDLKRN